MNRFKNFIAALALAVSSVAWLPAVTVKAVAVDLVCVWDAGGANNNMSTSENWVDPLCTQANMEDDTAYNLKLEFPANVADLTINNDPANGTLVHSITYSGAATSPSMYTISGNSIMLMGNISNNMTGTAMIQQSIDIDMVIGTSVEVSNATEGSYFYFNGIISGDGDITKSGTAGMMLYDNNANWNGDLIISDGYVYTELSATKSGLGSATGKTVVANGAQLRVGALAALSTSEPFEFTGSADSATEERINFSDENGTTSGALANYTITLTGAISIAEDINVCNYGVDLKITGALSGASKKINLKPGCDMQLEVASTSNTSGLTNGIYKSELNTSTIENDQSLVNGGATYNNKLVIKSPGKFGNVSVVGGILSGTGTVKNITMSSGTVAPGLSPGCLASNNLAYTGGTVEIEIKGTTKCTDYDQQTVTGTVSLGTNVTTLKVVKLTGYTAKVNDTFTIIDNDSTDAVTGTFKGLAEGVTFTTDGVTYKITYKGGTDSNDVVLTVTALPGSPNTGTYRAQYTSAVVFGGLSIAAGVYLLGGKKLKLPRRRK